MISSGLINPSTSVPDGIQSPSLNFFCLLVLCGSLILIITAKLCHKNPRQPVPYSNFVYSLRASRRGATGDHGFCFLELKVPFGTSLMIQGQRIALPRNWKAETTRLSWEANFCDCKSPPNIYSNSFIRIPLFNKNSRSQWETKAIGT